MIPELPDWFLRFVLAMVVVGVLASTGAIVILIVWLIKHVQFV